MLCWGKNNVSDCAGAALMPILLRDGWCEIVHGHEEEFGKENRERYEAK